MSERDISSSYKVTLIYMKALMESQLGVLKLLTDELLTLRLYFHPLN